MNRLHCNDRSVAAGFSMGASPSSSSVRCACGGWLALSTENLYGRTVETCSGPCGYAGPPRPVVEEVIPPRVPLSQRPCCEPGCDRPTYSLLAKRCRPHAEERRHEYQREFQLVVKKGRAARKAAAAERAS